MSPKYAGTRINNVLIADTISTNVESNMEDNDILLNTELGRQVTNSLVKFRGNNDQVCQQTWPLHTIV